MFLTTFVINGSPGTQSPFLWFFGYDPIIFAVHEATGVKPPTYVDDLSALVWGPEQALAVEIFVMAAGHAAGLRIDAHSCSSFHARSGIDTARSVLRAMPVAVHAVGYRGGFRVTGIPGALTQRLLKPKFDEQWAASSWIEYFPCRCIVKIQVIPSSRGRGVGRRAPRVPLRGGFSRRPRALLGGVSTLHGAWVP